MLANKRERPALAGAPRAMTDTTVLSDWALVLHYLTTCRAFIDPFTFGDVRSRGLLWVVNDLSSQRLADAKATAYGRLLKAGKVFGEEQIDEIAHHIEATRKLQEQIAGTAPTDTANLLRWAAELVHHAQGTADYFAHQ